MSSTPFVNRHIGPRKHEAEKMLDSLHVSNMAELIEKTIPSDILNKEINGDFEGISEQELLQHLKHIATKNKLYKTYIGLGYYNTICPSVISRNILENPDWYTSYTPYQAEISQGRLEALLNFQTMICELTKMEIANASLLDEATAAAEAMTMLFNTRSKEKNNCHLFFIDNNTFPQIIEVVNTRAIPQGIKVICGDYKTIDTSLPIFGALVQYPACNGEINNYSNFSEKMQQHGIGLAVVADLMSLSLLNPPGNWGADVVCGSAQRFGLPMGFGGPHAAYFAAKDKYKRFFPGRIIGISKDKNGRTALRMSLQTREQHIKREKATSNICTSQALLAIMAGMYAVYHGSDGIREIAASINKKTTCLFQALKDLGYIITDNDFFDTLKITLPGELTSHELEEIAQEHEINLRLIDKKTVGLSIDETTSIKELNALAEVFALGVFKKYSIITSIPESLSISDSNLRTDSLMQQEVFNLYRSETEMMRYIKKLSTKDISLTHSMIALGSCTMKMNAASELMPISWNEFSNMHPFVPIEQAEGYYEIIHRLGRYLCKITGMAEVSFMPNSGASGEYAGLMVIRQFHIKNNQSQRNTVLIPVSAHGTNPASAAMAGFKIVTVNCDEKGSIDVNDLKNKVIETGDALAALMVTYPSTFGVFDSNIRMITTMIHQHGGQVYMDGANMNAQVGLTSPNDIGADVCHLNLHKTFAIPHGGGGPGMGPICVANHLVPYLPNHPVIETGGTEGIGAISAAPYGSSSILIISYAYIKMLGSEGLKQSTCMAILNANYLAAKLEKYYKVLYKGDQGFNAHEFIIDCRMFKALADITETDIAKRLMDYGFHSPTLSFPVHGTLMIEPTESESLQELERFADSLIQIYHEIIEISDGKQDRTDNTLKNAPHDLFEITSDSWQHPYSREKAAFPLPFIKEKKYWPGVCRVDDAYGDRNLVCTCAPTTSYNN